jgi:hypothetical protein
MLAVAGRSYACPSPALAGSLRALNLYRPHGLADEQLSHLTALSCLTSLALTLSTPLREQGASGVTDRGAALLGRHLTRLKGLNLAGSQARGSLPHADVFHSPWPATACQSI